MAYMNIEDVVDEYLGKLPGDVYEAIRDYLDATPHKRHNFLAVLDGDFAMDIQFRGNTTSLLSELNGRGMTIRQFVTYAAMAEDAELLRICRLRVPVRILESPGTEVSIFEGDPLSLVVRTIGNPRPQFQWLKNGVQILEAHSATYYVAAASAEDGGIYQCEVFDGMQRLLTHQTRVVIYTPAPLEISIHPRPCRVELGQVAVFCCEPLVSDGVSFQWFMDDRVLQESANFRGTTSSELRIHNVASADFQGCYYCVLTKGAQQVYSQGAPLQIINFLPNDHSLNTTQFTATDKVALLIGCSDYRGTKILTAPRFDVQTLAASFQALQFKVVSLLNLTKVEMISAIQEFKQLVDEGVYCVFYFCGHGFESASNGFESCCYLVPVDAPTGYDHTHCVAAQFVCSILLEQRPAVCCMILDICRKHMQGATSIRLQRDMMSRDSSSGDVIDFPGGRVDRGNLIVCYGTCHGLAAYEDSIYGIFVSHLKNFLHQPIGIENVFQKLRSALGRDQRVHNERHLQIAEVKANLTETDRSFCDQIVYNGFTAQFNRHREIWERAHMKPDPEEIEIQFPGFTVEVRLTYQQEFSNVLKIYVTVLDPGPAKLCRAYISAVPMQVAEKADIHSVFPTSDSRIVNTYVSIKNIQRLREDMKVEITAACEMENGEELQALTQTDLQLPLVASLRLWQERPPVTRARHAVEQEEY